MTYKQKELVMSSLLGRVQQSTPRKGSTHLSYDDERTLFVTIANDTYKEQARIDCAIRRIDLEIAKKIAEASL